MTRLKWSRSSRSSAPELFDFQRFGQRPHQLAAVGKAGRRVGVRVALGEPLGLLIGFERILQILRAAPAEQDDRDVEQERDRQGASFRFDRRRRRSADGRTWLPSATNRMIAAAVGAAGDQMAAGDPDSLAPRFPARLVSFRLVHDWASTKHK